MNPLLLYIPSNQLRIKYEAIKNNVGDNGIIFDAMTAVTQGHRTPFVPPSQNGEYARKYQEIESLFRYKTLLGGVEILASLIDEVFNRVLNNNGTDGLNTPELLKLMSFEIEDKLWVALDENGTWVEKWEIRVPESEPEETLLIVLPLYKKDLGEIVPFYVSQYINSGIQAYKRRMFIAALALLSIAVEATLRDLLATRGYTYKHGAPSQDKYAFARALVGIEDNRYTVTFPDEMPKAVTDFAASIGGPGPLEVRIKRYMNRDQEMDLLIRTNAALVDHWSVETIVRPAEKVVSGLGKALKIARDDEKLISATDLPSDIDDVLQTVRNNLVHLSNEALDTVLPKLSQYSPTGEFKLRDFLENQQMVYDLVANIPTFIRDQYLTMRT